MISNLIVLIQHLIFLKPMPYIVELYIVEWFHFCPAISIIMAVLDAMELVFRLVNCFGKDAKDERT